MIFPKDDLPVWGADFVSLPGNKNLLLLDAQPVGGDVDCSPAFRDWYDTHIPDFPWGGDLPEPVQQYVSKYALWSRLENFDDSSTEEQLYEAFCQHLSLYLDLVVTNTAGGTLECQDYVKYRLENDPARPMLKRLYGEEWTEHVLENLLFPSL